MHIKYNIRYMAAVDTEFDIRCMSVYAFVLITATCCCPVFPTAWFNVFKLSKVLPHASLLAFTGANCEHITPVLRQLHCCHCGSVLNLKWPFWSTRWWTPCHHSTWWTTANSSQPLADNDFDHPMLLCVTLTFVEPEQVWVIDPSLLLVHVMSCKFIERVVIKKISHALNTMEPTLLCKQNCLWMPSEAGIADCRFLNATGRLFHTVGPATENAWRPYVVSL